MTSTEELEGAIGIDLGTTYSCVAIWRQQRVEIIPNDQGNRTTPSYLAFTEEGDRLVGDPARNQISKNPENTVYDAKRLIGRKFEEKEVQGDLPTWPFRVVKGDKGMACIDIEVKRGERKKFSPEEVSGQILARLKATAEQFLGKRVTKAVITVPAYFNDAQRTSTKTAGQLAGLEVLRIINEPTAAALAYGHNNQADLAARGRQVLVFDLGGGTFDVSLIALEGGVYEVKATAGDTHLGGQDFDNNLVQHCIKEFHKQHGVDLSEFPKAVRKLRTACEKAKRTLSASATAEVEVDGIHDGKDLLIKITRAKFEQLNKPLFEKCIKEVERVLADANADKANIDDVVMVGGSSRIPRVQELLSKFFGGKALSYRINPDEAVAIGAAIQANILAGSAEEKKDLSGMVLLDVTPLSIGLAVNGGAMDFLIKRNSTIPRKVTKVFTTIDDDQETVEVDVYEGERPRAKANHHLGMFELTGIPKGKAGDADIEVTFSVDANGVLTVSALEKKSGAKSNLTITNTNQLSPEDIAKMLKDAQQFAKDDKEHVKRLETRLKLETWAYDLHEAAEQENAPKAVLAEIEGHIDWIEANLETASQLELEEHMDDLAVIYEKLGKKKEKESGDADGKKKRGKKRKKDDEADESDFDDASDDPDWKSRTKGGKQESSDEGEGNEEGDVSEGGEPGVAKPKKPKKETRASRSKAKAAPSGEGEKPAAKDAEEPAAPEPKRKRLRKTNGEAVAKSDEEPPAPKPAESAAEEKPKKAKKKSAEMKETASEAAASPRSEVAASAAGSEKAKKEKKPRAKKEEGGDEGKEKAKRAPKPKKAAEGEADDAPAKKRTKSSPKPKPKPAAVDSDAERDPAKSEASDADGDAPGRASEEF